MSYADILMHMELLNMKFLHPLEDDICFHSYFSIMYMFDDMTENHKSISPINMKIDSIILLYLHLLILFIYEIHNCEGSIPF